VKRKPHPTDGRQAIVELSTIGLSFIEDTISAREAWLDQQLAGLSGEEREVLSKAAEVIDRMAGN